MQLYKQAIVSPERMERLRLRFIQAAMNIPAIEPGIRKSCIVLSNHGLMPVWSCEGHAEREGEQSLYVVYAANEAGLSVMDKLACELLNNHPCYWDISVCKLMDPECDNFIDPLKEDTYFAWSVRARFANTEDEVVEARMQLLAAAYVATGTDKN